jgi:type IV pilus assembly protein PilW
MSNTFRQILPEGRSQQFGFSLVELMVAMVIGLIILLVVGTLFANSRQTYLMQDANSRLQENARYATELLSRQIRMAGYTAINFSPLAGADLFAKPASYSFAGTPIAGIDGGAASDSITLSFDNDRDCLGNAVSTATNRFQINASNQLECISGGATGVLLDDIEAMQVLYRQTGSTVFQNAGSVNMSNVVSVRICLLLRAMADVNKKAVDSDLINQSYVDCSGSTQTMSDGYIRRAVTTTVAIRNRLP